jgi:hypothetical protein
MIKDKKIILGILISFIIILSIGLYIYNNEGTKKNDDNEDVYKDVTLEFGDFFSEYLLTVSSHFLSENIDSFSESDVRDFFVKQYINFGTTAKKSSIKELAKKYFNINDYIMEDGHYTTFYGTEYELRLVNEVYESTLFERYPHDKKAELKNIISNGNEFIVTYNCSNLVDFDNSIYEKIGEIVIYLVKNDNNYNINRIKYESI